MSCGGHEHSEFASPLACSIWRAAQTQQLARVKEIIEKGTQSANSKDESGYSALHYAARTGNNSIVNYLISKNAQVRTCLVLFN